MDSDRYRVVAGPTRPGIPRPQPASRVAVERLAGLCRRQAPAAADDPGRAHRNRFAGLTQPIEILTTDPTRIVAVTQAVPGGRGRHRITRPGQPGSSRPPGRRPPGRRPPGRRRSWSSGPALIPPAAPGPRPTANDSSGRQQSIAGAQVGGIPAQNADFITAVYGNAWWILLIIVAVTFLLLARALRSIVLPIKALVLNVISVARRLRRHRPDLAARIRCRCCCSARPRPARSPSGFRSRSSHSCSACRWTTRSSCSRAYARSTTTAIAPTTRPATDVARTGRLVTSAALILFLAFIALSRVPDTDVKILATALALGIIIDATIVRGILAPALVAALGNANWWLPRPATRR